MTIAKVIGHLRKMPRVGRRYPHDLLRRGFDGNNAAIRRTQEIAAAQHTAAFQHHSRVLAGFQDHGHATFLTLIKWQHQMSVRT